MEKYYNNIKLESPIKDSYKSFEEKILEAIDDYENGRMLSHDAVWDYLDKKYKLEK